ncbi:hypothetical protein JCM9152_1562 [Halalkalibacter hemicellulosilyticusJCM 9152]|uniref:Uncharacterized protein n=1 Tax=Halalkalibacter hemicellulosilyticusJCM 9152 TaxID=1236971 RepID=W4QDN5_9BACI|nr:hypothetical protein JCM9152_1562 [Halalkalibacter hemicellulosilyticusJCM 9152]
MHHILTCAYFLGSKLKWAFHQEMRENFKQFAHTVKENDKNEKERLINDGRKVF